jgi:hypothetical protein
MAHATYMAGLDDANGSVFSISQRVIRYGPDV